MFNSYKKINNIQNDNLNNENSGVLNHQTDSNRNRLVNKVEKAISKVKFNDTKKLIGIAKTISMYQLENAQGGRTLAATSLEEFVSKVVMNDNNILSGTDISYYLSIAKNNKKSLQTQKVISDENAKVF